MAGLAVRQKGTPAMETASSEKALVGMAEIFFFFTQFSIFQEDAGFGKARYENEAIRHEDGTA